MGLCSFDYHQCSATALSTCTPRVSSPSRSSETSTTNVPTGQKLVTINGIPVYVGFGSPTTLYWTAPSLGVQIIGTGPDSSQVLHTLHNA